jgi:hypothetical protein
MRARRLLPEQPAAIAAVLVFAACGGSDGARVNGSSGSNLNGQSSIPPGGSGEGDDAGPSPASMAGSNDLGTDRTRANPADGGSALPATGLSARCSASFSTVLPAVGLSEPPVRDSQASLAVDPAGNVIVATGFQKGFTVGSQTLSPLGGAEDYGNYLAVVKLDPQCHVLWTKQLGAYGAELDLSAVAADGSGDVILGGSFHTTSGFPGMGEVDFGTGPVAAPFTSAFVLKLDPSGATRWAKVYSGNGSSSDFVDVLDVAASSTDHVVVAIQSDTPINFGAGALSAGDAGSGDGRYLVELEADGSLGFARPSDAFAPSSWLIDSVDVASDGSFWIGGTGPIDSAINGWSGSSSLRAVHLDASGAVLASQTIAPPGDVGWNGGAVRVGASGDAIVSGAWAADDTSSGDWTRWFGALAPNGEVRWTYPALSVSQGAWDPAELVRVDAEGRAWTAGEIAAPLDLGAPVGTLTASPSGSGYVAILGTGGHVLSGSAPVALASVLIEDMGLIPGGDLVVMGWDATSGSVTVTKLGF